MGEYAAIIGAAAAVVGAGVASYSAYAQGQAQGDAAKFNAQSAELQAQQARDAAKIDADNQALAANRAQAGVRARAAASGVDPGYGSPLLVMMDNARQSEMERQRILYGGEVRAAGFQSGASLSRFQGGAAENAGNIGAGVNLLSGIARVGSQYSRPRGAGSGLLSDSV